MAWIQANCKSAELHMPIDFQVLLPQYTPGGGRGAIGNPGPYKTLYLLHGHGGSGVEWLRQTSIERYMAKRPMGIVLPDGHNSFWANMTTGFNYHTFITEELPYMCEKWFPLSSKREDRYVAGISMGGYGALNAALNRPDVFSKVAAVSPVTDLSGLFDRDGQTVKADWIFGSREKYLSGSDNLYNAAQALAQSGKARPEILLTCGSGDGLYEPTKKFRAHLDSLGIYSDFFDTEGVHNWEYGDMIIPRVIDWLGVEKEEV